MTPLFCSVAPGWLRCPVPCPLHSTVISGLAGRRRGGQHCPRCRLSDGAVGPLPGSCCFRCANRRTTWGTFGPSRREEGSAWHSPGRSAGPAVTCACRQGPFPSPASPAPAPSVGDGRCAGPRSLVCERRPREWTPSSPFPASGCVPRMSSCICLPALVTREEETGPNVHELESLLRGRVFC